MNFHPKGDAFWQPIFWAIPGFLFGMSVGWVVSGVDKPGAIMGGVVVGLVSAWVTWAILATVWLDILARTYQPAPAPIEPEIEEETGDDFDPARISIKCFASPQDTHILHDLPIEYTDFFDYANGILRDHRSTVFSEWVGPRAMGRLWRDQEDYKKLVNWMVRWGYGDKDHRGVLKINDRGNDLLEDILHPQFETPYPAGNENMAKIHIPQYTRLNQ